jgi:hypothetical protein
MASRSIEAALVLGILSCLLAGVLALAMIPSE